MTTARAIVFLSHINEEAQLAAHLKHEVEEAFIRYNRGVRLV